MPDPEGSSSSSVHIRTIEHQLTRDEIVPVVYRQAFQRWQTWILPIAGIWRMSRPAWNLGDGPEQLSYAATSSFGV